MEDGLDTLPDCFDHFCAIVIIMTQIARTCQWFSFSLDDEGSSLRP